MIKYYRRTSTAFTSLIMSSGDGWFKYKTIKSESTSGHDWIIIHNNYNENYVENFPEVTIDELTEEEFFMECL